MIDEQLRVRGITDPRLLAAFLKVPRHLFVSADWQDEAYADRPIPIDQGQTVSQPYMVALMIHLLRLHGHERVLEIGTGSGYQLAILAELALEVYSVERLPVLAGGAARRLESLGYENVRIMPANGSMGWSEYAPYDGIIVSAAAPAIPVPLTDQLSAGGRLVIPIGSPHVQTLTVVEKTPTQLKTCEVTSCVFVPLVGQHGWPPT